MEVSKDIFNHVLESNNFKCIGGWHRQWVNDKNEVVATISHTMMGEAYYLDPSVFDENDETLYVVNNILKHH